MRTALKVFVLLFLSFISLKAQERSSGQDRSPWATFHRLDFAYDGAGNRISKELIFLSTGNRSEGGLNEEKKEPFATEYIAHHKVLLYPNPTYGKLSIKIPTLEGQNTNWSISIHKLNGELLRSQSVLGQGVDLDITSYEAGLYILFIRIGKEQSRWKIVKK